MSDSTPLYLSEDEARTEICRVGRELFTRGYVHATAGNISVKLAQGFLITPTDACPVSYTHLTLPTKRIV